ncbi:hypothetical protein [Williamsia phyllosphaerae]|uniref:Uncharacterized protein n=1 Tax=Williamsia phyllosphaerae TaxID=885042 RepID=A0ABQ1UJ39_9NOCA|nr:hypothetical protein [Williamsia phyllosphaerae]GGF19124.1 hypothetical protein GCM10007298_13990 [Williamsia phyllosphaerae]
MRLRQVVTSCLAAVVVTGILGSCGSSDPGDGATTPTGSAGAVFEGTYSMFRTTASVNREPPSGADADPVTSTWVVQSRCDDGTCVAVARPDTSSGGDVDRMEFVFGNGSWSRVDVPPKRSCVPTGTTAPVDEPWVAMDSTTVMPRSASTAGAAPATLSGTTSSVQGGSCPRVSEGTVTFTRKGDVPAGTAALEKVSVPEAATTAGNGFRGSYRQRTTVVSWDPPSLISRPTTQTTEFTATPTCTRDGSRCVVVMLDRPSRPGQTIVGYSDGVFRQTETLPERQCPGRGDRYRPTLTSQTTVGGDASNPIQTLDNESALAWSGACAGTVRFRAELTRTGD